MDYRKKLEVLHTEWMGCRKCDLHTFRDEKKQRQVFGRGHRHGIMFLSAAPTDEDATVGDHYAGAAHEFMSELLERLDIKSSAYFANLVLCRSCGFAYNSEGQAVMTRFGPLVRDEPPKEYQIASCSPYLGELIYMVDPLLIVGMGIDVIKAMSGRSANLLVDSGQEREITIDGVWQNPVVTPKKQQWGRKIKGVETFPLLTNQVRYLMLLCEDVRDVLARSRDNSIGNRMDLFLQTIKKAADIYHEHRKEDANVTT